MATKSLDSAQAKRAKEILNRILRDDYGGSQTAMAGALKVKQPTLWSVLNGKKGAGGRMLSALYAVNPLAHAEIMGGPGGHAPVTAAISADITNDFTASAQVQVIDKPMMDRVAQRLSRRPGWDLPRGLLAVHRVKGLTSPDDDALYNAAVVADLDASGATFPRFRHEDLNPEPPKKLRGKR